MQKIQLKSEHEHLKKRSQSVALEQKSSPLQSQIISQNINPFGQLASNDPKPSEFKSLSQVDNTLNPKQPSQAIVLNNSVPQNRLKQVVSKDNQIPKREQQVNKRQEKGTKAQKQKNNNQKEQKPQNKQEKALTIQIVKKQGQAGKQLQGSVSSQVEGKKKKKKKKQIPQPEQIDPEQRLTIQTQNLYTSCTHRHKINFTHEHPQLMSLLKQSYRPFAMKEIQCQKLIISSGQDILLTMNPAKYYNTALFTELDKRKRFHEDRIYLGVLEENQLFSDLIWREEIHSQPRKEEVALLFGDLHMLVMNDVWEGEYEIRPKETASKDEIIYGSYKANQIRMTESIIKDKLSSLNEELTIDGQDEPAQFLNHKKFDLNSQETKKAQEFVKKLQQEDKLLKERARKVKQQQEEEQMRRLQEQQEQRKRQQQQKIQERRIKLLQKAEQRQRLKKYRQQQQRQYEQYLSQHRQKTPLFKKKQEDFKAFMVKQQMRKFQQLREVQKSKRPISKEQIELHQMKYKQLKQLLDQERQELMKLQQEQADDRYLSFYKGKFHDSIMNELDRKTVGEIKKDQASELYSKKLEYATAVKCRFAPKIDPKKKEELQLLINDLKPKPKNDQLLAQKTKMEGYRNLQKLHQLMAEMKAKGKLKKPQTPQLDTPQPKSSRYINYLHDIKTSRMNSSSMRKSRFTSLDVSKLNRSSLGAIEMQARNLEEHADRKSMFLKNTKNLDMEDYLARKFQLEEDYIESAKAKLQVLGRYELGE